jgi:hypothetical protein
MLIRLGALMVNRDGEYVVWFRTPGGNGTGRIFLADGRLSGGDAYITYEGSYQLDGDNYRAVIKTKRHAEGAPTWFGLDEVMIRIAGKFIERTADGNGTIDQCPGLELGVTLMRVHKETPRPDVDYSRISLHPERLPRAEPER